MSATGKLSLSYYVLSLLSLIAFLAISTGCSGSQSASQDEDVSAPGGTSAKLRVASTVSPITSLAENIGGNRIALTGIVPEGTNSHTFEPSPSVAAILAEADLFIANGLFLEEPTIRMAEANQKEGAAHLILGPKTITQDQWVFDFSFPKEDGHPNPHLWTDPHLALRYAIHIRNELVRMDADNAEYYNDNFGELSAKINDLDQRIIRAVSTIPRENRLLLTYHDSFPYFGPRYGFEIIGAVQPSDFTEPSAREVAALIEQVRESQVPAIFGSEVFPSPVLRQIAQEGGAEFVDQLRDDDLPGEPGDPEHTYLGLILEDVRIITVALGGDTGALDGFDPSPVFEEDSGAVYPQ
ncbi:MAG: metal ABC transporter substrate-binding protein [Chloroflexi bacterium]|nr:metal ABC transporter substrate-binding protein [Chloroflexota bacterium]